MLPFIIDYQEFVTDMSEYAPGYVTLNLPLLSTKFESVDLEPMHVMTPINPAGYDMNPSKNQVEDALRNFRGQVIAMNILGGGAFSIEKSLSYLNSLGNIEYLVVGASTKKHLEDIVFTSHCMI